MKSPLCLRSNDVTVGGLRLARPRGGKFKVAFCDWVKVCNKRKGTCRLRPFALASDRFFALFWWLCPSVGIKRFGVRRTLQSGETTDPLAVSIRGLPSVRCLCSHTHNVKVTG
jgi:hypothetical protein